MSKCEITTSVFSAGVNNHNGIHKGWLGETADQLIEGKRYVGIDAVAAATDLSLNVTRGHLSTIIHDCADDCEVYGSMYNDASDGKLKSRAIITIASSCTIAILQDIFCSQDSIFVKTRPGNPVPPNNCECPTEANSEFVLDRVESEGHLCQFRNSVGDGFTGFLRILNTLPCQMEFTFFTPGSDPLGGGWVQDCISGPFGALLPDFDPLSPFPMFVPAAPVCRCNGIPVCSGVGGWRIEIREFP